MSVGRLCARPLAPEDTETWETLACQYGTVFSSLRWTGLFGTDLTRVGIYESGGGLRGGFVVWRQRYFGARVLRNPPYTPQIGPFYEPRASNAAARTDEQRAVVEAMTEYLSSSGAVLVSLVLAPEIIDSMPFRWRGWKVIPRYTYRLDLSLAEDVLMSGLSPKQRNSLKKAERDGFVVEQALDASDIRALVLRTFARQGKTLPSGAMDKILAEYPPGTDSYCCVACLDDAPLAATYVIHDSQTAYSLMTGYDYTRSHAGAGVMAMWHAILRAKELGLGIFDFEGSVIPSVERFFRGFGAALTPMFSVHRAWLPLEMGLKLVRRHTF